jgi:hypothetical protein
MQTYFITLLTPSGLKSEIYTTAEPLQEFEARMITKYGTFVTISSKLTN